MQRPLALALVVFVVAGTGALYLTGSRNGAPAGPPPHQTVIPRRLRSDPPGSPRPSGVVPSPSSVTNPSALGASRTLTYLRGTRIFSWDVGSGAPRAIADLHTADVTASTSSPLIAYVIPQKGSDPSANGDFVLSPELHLLDMESGDDVDLGPGFSPLWNALGRQFVYLSPTQPRGCDGETCTGTVRVNLAVPGQPTRPISGPGHWHLLAWSGDRVLVSEDGDPSQAISLSSTGGPSFAIQVPPSEIWDASPKGDELLAVAQGKISLLHLERGRPTGEVHTIATRASLGDGTWSAGSGVVAAALIEAGRQTRLALLSGTGPPEPVAGSEGAMGNVVWNVAGDHFAYVSIDSADPSRLQASLCHLTAGRTTCRDLFSWSQGVSLLKLAAS